MCACVLCMCVCVCSLQITGRMDDVINVAGHRLSTGQMEEVLAGHSDVAECAVIGVADQLKGQLPMGFLCLNAGCNRPHDEIVAECVTRVRRRSGHWRLRYGRGIYIRRRKNPTRARQENRQLTYCKGR